MEVIIGALSILICICLPLILFYSRSSWIKKNNSWRMFIVILPLIHYLTYAFFHELSHIIGISIVGGEIIDYQLIPRFWKGDLSTAYVEHNGGTKIQEFIITISPYLKDIIFIPIGFLILKSKRIINAFIIGLIFMFFILGSLTNVFTNFMGFIVSGKGDFYQINEIIGILWTIFIGVSIFIFALIFILRVYKLYTGFPNSKYV